MPVLLGNMRLNLFLLLLLRRRASFPGRLHVRLGRVWGTGPGPPAAALHRCLHAAFENPVKNVRPPRLFGALTAHTDHDASHAQPHTAEVQFCTEWATFKDFRFSNQKRKKVAASLAM